MIKSMTGFGKGEAKGKSGVFTVELRSVNHRYFDLSAKMPNSLALLEDRLKELINKHIKRGKVNFFLSYKPQEKEALSISVDKQAVAKYRRILTEIKKQAGVKEEIGLSHILSFSDVIAREDKDIDVEAVWVCVKEAAIKAVSGCNRMREMEGKALYKDFSARLKTISEHVSDILKTAPMVVEEYKNKLDARIKDIIKDKPVDTARLETELAIFAKQCDISEELTRARSHLDGFKKAIESGEEAGRKLDFILQELNREVNTIGSKANDIRISRVVIDIKSELEKMREQAQNVE